MTNECPACGRDIGATVEAIAADVIDAVRDSSLREHLTAAAEKRIREAVKFAVHDRLVGH